MQISPYGSWKSPITAQKVISGAKAFRQIAADGNHLYLVEARAEKKGASTILRYADHKHLDLHSAPFNARTTVHEYGGNAMAVQDGVIYFSNYSDQHIYKLQEENSPQFFAGKPDERFADFDLSKDGKWLFAIMEKHTDKAVENFLVSIERSTGDIKIIAKGHDFFASPKVSPDGKWLAYYLWDHPNMPWDETRLVIAPISADGSLGKEIPISCHQNTSAIEPKWAPDGSLFYVDDQSGFWNLYCYKDGVSRAITKMEAEFSTPPWLVGNSSYDFLQKDDTFFIVAAYTIKGTDYLALIDPVSKKLSKIDLPYTSITDVVAYKNTIAMLVASPTELPKVICFDPINRKEISVAISQTLDIDKKYLSIPELIEFNGANNQPSYGFYYPPTNADYVDRKNEKPPLIVTVHGGPTSHVKPVCSFATQYWTSRGIGVFAINYSGSTGHGRAYRDRLKKTWGKSDVEDCCSAADYLVKEKGVDPNRIAIRGGSAGGYTTNAALVFTDVFKAGTSLYGVSDLGALATETHKFEARYLDLLIGPYPEEKDLYDELSPVNSAENLSCPLLLLQGDEDKVVLPNQSEMMFEAAKKKGIPTAYLLFRGEQHGFRQAENIIKALEAELFFYSKIFHFTPHDVLPQIPIENLN